MKIAVIGASGNVGSRLSAEALSRGHQVTGIARHADKIAPRPGLTAVAADAADIAALARALRGHDVAISSTRFNGNDPHATINAAKQAGVKRLLVVGGAGSLNAGGTRLVDSPQFPAAYKPEALAGAGWLEALRQEKELDWIFLSPSAFFLPGERTGKFRLGKDDLLVGADGKSSISIEDYAIAMFDEIERPRHSRQRFTVGY